MIRAAKGSALGGLAAAEGAQLGGHGGCTLMGPDAITLPPVIDRRELGAIFLGGALGALLRAGLAEAFPAGAAEWNFATGPQAKFSTPRTGKKPGFD